MIKMKFPERERKKLSCNTKILIEPDQNKTEI